MMFPVTEGGGANFSSRDFKPDLLHPSILAQILKVIPVLNSSWNSAFKNYQDVEDSKIGEISKEI